jgi:hypothetical protein
MSRRLDHAVNVAARKARCKLASICGGNSGAERQAIGWARIGRLPTSGLLPRVLSLHCLQLRWSTRRRFDPSSSPSASLPNAAYSPGRTRGQLSPITAVIPQLSSVLSIGKAGLLFSERPVSLRSSGLHPLGTVFEIRTFRATCKLQRKVVFPLLSDRLELLIFNSPS